MTQEVIAVRPEVPLREVAAVLATKGISGVPVIDEDDRVLGVLSEADILAKVRASEPVGGGLGWLLDREGALELDSKLAARTAHEAMSAPPVVIDADSPVSRAAALMLDAGVNRLPVLEEGRIVGVVTRTDLLRAFVRSDDEIVREIRDEVLPRTFLLAPDAIEIEVADGEVTLKGEVETGTEAKLLRSFVQSVPGVVSVHSALTWRVGDRGQGPPPER